LDSKLHILGQIRITLREQLQIAKGYGKKLNI